MGPLRRLTGTLLAPLLLAALVSCKKSDAPRDSKGTPPEASLAKPPPGTPRLIERALLDAPADCDVFHHGLVIDWAVEGPFSSSGFRLTKGPSLRAVERGGGLFRTIGAERVHRIFYWQESTDELSFDLLAHSTSAERLVVEIDGRVVSEIKLVQGELKRVSVPLRPFKLTRGHHRIGVFAKKGRGAPPSVELGWTRLSNEAIPKDDLPPTRAETFSEVTMMKERRRSLVLREGTRVRCALRVSEPNAKLTFEAGVWGEGRGEVELSLRNASGPYRALDETLGLEDAGKLRSFSVTFPEKGNFAEVYFAAPRLARSARLVFAEPTLSFSVPASSPSPRATTAIVVVLSGLSRRHFPGLASQNGLPLLDELRAESVLYSSYRASTTQSGHVLKSLTHQLPSFAFSEARRPLGLLPPTLGERLRIAGGKSAFFTSVPTSFEWSGVSRGFQVVEQFSPKEDLSALLPITRSRQLLETSASSPKEPLLLLLHLRGGHPPFDLSREEARELPPAEYGGDLDPRRAAIQLEHVRKRPVAARRILPEEDWTRLEALSRAALLAQSRALSELVALLKKSDRWDETLFIVMGDVGAGAPKTIPYSETAELGDEYLGVPLLVKYPRSKGGGREESGKATTMDVAATIATSLGLKESEGLDLGASDFAFRSRERPLVSARLDRYVTELGVYSLRGRDGAVPVLCRLDLDPGCSVDRSDAEIDAHRALFRMTHDLLAASEDVQEPPATKPNDETRDALEVWGVSDLSDLED